MQKVNASPFAAEEDDAIVQLSENPVPETDFVRHCAQRRKYPILLKVKYPNLFKVTCTQFKGTHGIQWVLTLKYYPYFIVGIKGHILG